MGTGIRPHGVVRRLGTMALLVLAGCAGGSGSNPFSRASPEAETLHVTIDNQNFNDASIYAIWRGRGRNRVGTVTGNTSRTFELPYRGETVRFEVDFLAGGEYVGEEIYVGPGDHIDLRLPPGPG